MKKIIRALVCTFFIFAITIVNLPHFPIFQCYKAQASTKQIINEATDQCSLNIDFEKGQIKSNIQRSCCSSTPDTQNVQKVDSNLSKYPKAIALILTLFNLSILVTLSTSFLVLAFNESRTSRGDKDAKLAQALTGFCILNSDLCINGKPSSGSSREDSIEAIQFKTEVESPRDISTGQSTGKRQHDPIKILNTIKNNKIKIERQKKKLEEFLSLCIQRIVCENPNGVFAEGGDSRVDSRIISPAFSACLKEIGVILRGNPETPCVCKDDNCACAAMALCKTMFCSEETSCECVDDDCICPIDVICNNVQCTDGKCSCLDDACNTDSDCGTEQVCKLNNTLNQTFSGVSESVGSSSSGSSSSSSSGGTFSGVGSDLSSSGSTSSGGTFSGVSGSVGSSSSGCDVTLHCPSPLVLDIITCTCVTPSGMCESSGDEDSRCGDGVADENEECDDGASNSLNGPCLPTCQLAKCGDGVFQSGLGEECDDGNTNNNDGCSADCKIESCSSNSDCASGLCIKAPKPVVCTKTAENDCPDDFSTKICLPKFCKKNNECGSIGICKQGECIVRPGTCGKNEDCDNGSGEVCDNGRCATPCQTDDNCDSGKCDTNKKICIKPTKVKPGTCNRDEDCDSASDEVCDNGRCAEPCQDDDDCSNGRMCDSGKKICIKPGKVKPGTCNRDEDCDNQADEVCDNKSGQCTTPCETDNDCDSGRMCDGSRKICIKPGKVKPETCTRDEDCDSTMGQSCDPKKKICIKPRDCNSDNDCDAQGGEKCDNGKCMSTCGAGPCVVIPVSCLNVKCPIGQVCRDGKCIIQCKSNAECPQPKVCKLGRCLI